MPTRLIETDIPIDLGRTLRPLLRGRADPTMKVGAGVVVRASRTPDGPVTIRFAHAGGGVEAETWGAGAAWTLERAPAWCGALDDDSDFDPPKGLVRELWRRHRGLRIPTTGLLTERLIPVILEQKVTGNEARRAYRTLTRALGEPAPGPFALTLPADPERVAALPYYAFHPFGVAQRRAELLKAVCARTRWIDEVASLPLDEARARLSSISGIGPWTTAEVARIALGDADAVSIGDYHVPNIVAWALAREPRGSDERMLELLEPYRPHRGRSQLLIEAAHITAPAYGPRMEPAAIERI